MKRLFSFILSLVLVVPALFSCTRTDENILTITDWTDNSSATSAMKEQSDFYKSGLPPLNYEGYQFRILTYTEALRPTIFNVESENGEVLNDALYARNIAVEEQLGIKLVEIRQKGVLDIKTDFRNAVNSGDDAYDMAVMLDREALALAVEGLILSVEELPNIDLSQPYWDHNAKKSLSINNKLYFTYGDDSLTFFEHMCVLLFNKGLIKDLSLDNPYDLVRQGEWTIDKMYEMARAAVKDLNGDGVMTDSDRFGIVFNANQFFPNFWCVNEESFVEKDENDLPFFNVPGNERMMGIFNKLYDCSVSTVSVQLDINNDKLDKYSTNSDKYSAITQMLANNQALFCSAVTNYISTIRSSETDFGILPFPKLEQVEAGTPYFSRIGSSAPNIVPITCADAGRTSAVMEALACESKNYIIPAYYNTALLQKDIRDSESEEMLDMMYNNRLIDIGSTFWYDMIGAKYNDYLSKKNNAFASLTETLQEQVDLQLKKTIEAFTK
ncbi:MAG: hypothetical protein AB9835_13275 [Eubacteriales bacterium]